MRRLVVGIVVASFVAGVAPLTSGGTPAGALGPGTVSGRVWTDVDADGVIDASERGIAAATVSLRSAGVDGAYDTADDIVFPSATTNASGNYVFDLLPAGGYRVRVDTATVPAGTALTTPAFVDVVLTLTANTATADFGFRWTASIGDVVWLDSDADGALDAGESGIAGIDVTLVEAGADAAFDTADDITYPDDTSDAAGAYGFSDLPPGAYRVTLDSAALPSGSVVTGAASNPTTLTLAAGETRADVDFAVRYTASIGDRVWLDRDADGVQDAGESGIAGVTVTLSSPGPDATLGTADDTTTATTTNNVGLYAFADLAPGDYRVAVDTATAPAGSALVTPGHVDIDLAPHGAVDTADFGFRWTGSIGDLVWLDADGDGVRDAGENGIEGVTVTLVDAGPDATFGTADDDAYPDVTTDAAGAYFHPNLPAGSYRVGIDTASLPAGTVVAGAAANPTTAALGAGGARDDVDFAARYTGSIGDRVWLDADADGTQDAGESGLGGVTVRLFAPGPDATLGTVDDVVVSTTATDGSGAYLFTLLGPGPYRVQVDPSSAPAGTAATTPVNRDVELAPHGAVADADFGFRWTGSIGDRVWLDRDADGAQDAGESGIAGVR